MRFKLPPLAFVIFLLCVAGSLQGQTPWSGVLDPSRAVNWSNVGAAHINDTRTQCVTSACSTVSSGTTVTAASISSALASAPANSYVLIPAGSFTISAAINFPTGGSNSGSCTSNCSNITLRGMGANSTFLVFTGSGSSAGGCGGSHICASSSDISYAGAPSNAATWSGASTTTTVTSGTYTQGGTYISLSSVTNLSVGAPLILDQIDNQSDNGGLYVGCEIGGSNGGDTSPACYQSANPGSFERGEGALSTIRGQQQIVNITSISGTGPYTVGITPGIYAANWSSAKRPGAWWASSPVYNDGVENLSYDNSEGGDASPGKGINFFNCTGCWAKGIRSVMTNPNSGAWYHVGFNICNHCTVRDSYHYGYTGDVYGFAVYIGSDILMENNIAQYPAEDFFTSSDCEGCVATYNFTVNPYMGSSAWLSLPDYYHAITLFSLQEGNIGAGHMEDSFHGTHDLNTQFRNRWDGHEQNNGNATTTDTVAVDLSSGARYANVIGNVLGTPGYHTVYKNVPPGTNISSAVLNLGYWQDGTLDSLVPSTAMLWGNWDVVTNGARWCGNSSDPGWSATCASTSEVPTGLSSYSNAVPSSTALPPSFVYATQPTWWPSGKAWPNIGPDVTGGNVGQCSGGTYNSSEVTSSQNSQCSTGGGTWSAVGGGLVVSNPAMDCYFNVMGGVANGTGSPLSFDAATCYSSSAPNPPSGLTAAVSP